MLLSNKNQMKNASKLNSNLPPLSLPLKGGEATSSINPTLSGGEQKRGLFKDRKSQSAFTLVELAIVIVVIGILAASIVGAQSIIRSAKINSSISQMSSYNTAINAFDLEFGGLPGDFDEAMEYQIDRDSTGYVNTCSTDSAINRNGNGDGFLDTRSSNLFTPFRYFGEVSNFFPHLQNAGLINPVVTKEDFSCTIETDTIYTVGDDYPAISVGESIIAITNHSNKKLHYLVGLFASTIDSLHVTARHNNHYILTPKDASDIDKKIDDGKPHSGIVFAIEEYLSSTWTLRKLINSSNCKNNQNYNVSYDGNACTLAIEAGKF
jgi:prepilin-type N-terminal cleavage/methylation domain-containing protein